MSTTHKSWDPRPQPIRNLTVQPHPGTNRAMNRSRLRDLGRTRKAVLVGIQQVTQRTAKKLNRPKRALYHKGEQERLFGLRGSV